MKILCYNDSKKRTKEKENRKIKLRRTDHQKRKLKNQKYGFKRRYVK